MKILRLKLTDFFSIGSAEIDLTNPLGLVLVEGQDKDSTHASSNGSGKSALVSEPILWCLKGVTLRGAKGDQVVRSGAKWCSVEVTVELHGKLWSITRYQQHPKYRNGISLAEMIIGPGCGPSVDVSARSKAEVQKQIDELIPLSIELLSSILILGEGFENRFAHFTNKQKLEFIETLIGDSWDDPHSAARRKAESMRSEVSRLESRIPLLKQQAADLITRAEREAERIKAELKTYRLREEKVLSGLSDLHAIDPPDENGIEALKEHHQAAQQQIANMTAKQSEVKSRIKKIKDLHSRGVSECPTCLQEVPGGYAESVLYGMLEETETWHLAIEGRTLVADKTRRMLEEKQQAVSAYHSTQQRMKSMEWELSQVRDSISGLESRVPGALDPQELGRIQTEIRECVESVGKLNIDLPYSEFWEQGFSAEGVRSYRIDSVLTWINERLDHYCGLLYDGSVVVRLTPERALKSRKGVYKNEITIEATFPGADYFTASRGERRKADLALHLALQDLAIRVSGFQLNLLVADEVLDSLDRESIERALKLLQQRAADVGTVFLVTHEEGLRSQVENAWMVIKEGGVSRLAR